MLSFIKKNSGYWFPHIICERSRYHSWRGGSFNPTFWKKVLTPTNTLSTHGPCACWLFYELTGENGPCSKNGPYLWTKMAQICNQNGQCNQIIYSICVQYVLSGQSFHTLSVFSTFVHLFMLKKHNLGNVSCEKKFHTDNGILRSIYI